MSRQLVVNADDYGLAPGVSRGILAAYKKGIVTSTTMKVNHPDIEDQMLDALASTGMGLGLHLVFTAWRPVLPPAWIPGLVTAEGSFLDQHSVWACAERVPLDQIEAELSAQVERFADLAGVLPDHLDCHHFVHLYPPFFQVYADLAARFNLPLRVAFPLETNFGRAVQTLPFLKGFPRDLVRGMLATNSALVKARQLAYPDRFIGTFFGRKALALDHLLGLLDTLPDGVSELMCHPGYDDPALATSSYRSERETELCLLTHPAVRARLVRQGIELVTFAALGERLCA